MQVSIKKTKELAKEQSTQPNKLFNKLLNNKQDKYM